MKITLVTIGKLKSSHIKGIVEDYSNRLKHYTNFELKTLSNETAMLKLLSPNDFFVALDEHGSEFTSEKFAGFIAQHQNRGTKKIIFLIGAASGIGKETLKRANLVMSLSKLTFAHELVYAIFTEQLYRAFTIIKGEPYHRK